MFRLNHTLSSNGSCRWFRRQLQRRRQSSLVPWTGTSSAPNSKSVSALFYSSSSFRFQKDDKDPPPEIKHAEWIPPNRPLHGDQDHSQLFKTQQDLDRAEDALFTVEQNESEEETLKRLEEALALEEQLEAERQKEFVEEELPEPDWLQTRRQALGNQSAEQSEVTIRHHELLTEDEFVRLLEIVGGQDVMVLPDDDEYPRMGGAKGMILCTAESSFMVLSITKNLVHHLKERHLEDLGVAGAKMKYFLQTSDKSSNWNVIDCRNFIVHIFDAKTRNALNLEELWSGKDPLWKLNTNDEDSMDDYVADHFVPFAYGPNTEGLYGDATISKLQRQQWLTPHRPVIPTEQKLKDRRAERRARRERKRREAKEAYYY